jgi:hypothetical protein
MALFTFALATTVLFFIDFRPDLFGRLAPGRGTFAASRG